MQKDYLIKKSCSQLNHLFCYCCGNYNKTSVNRTITDYLKKMFFDIFKYYPRSLDENWVGKVICTKCYKKMKSYLDDKSETKNNPFLPTLWRRPKLDHSDCYMCNFEFHKVNHTIAVCPDNCSVTLSKDRNLNQDAEMSEETTEEFETKDNIKDFDYVQPFNESINAKSPKLMDQPALNDLIRGIECSIDQSLFLASILKSRNLCTPEVRVECYTERYKEVLPFLDEYDDGKSLTPYVKDIPGLFRWFGIEFIATDWRCFIDSNLESTKCCLLPNIEENSFYFGKRFPVVPILISKTLKENYECMRTILGLINFYQHDFLICCDLKLINILCGLGPAQSSFNCFLCEFKSTRDEYVNHYAKEYPMRANYSFGEVTTLRQSLVKKEKVILPPLHIMLGLYTSFIKSIQENELVFEYLESFFPEVSKAKIKEGILVGPQIHKLIDDQTFYNFLNEEEASAWESFTIYVNDFLCTNTRPENYLEIGENLKITFGRLKKNMSLKVHLATQHIDFFQLNCAKYSEQTGERFHKDYHKIEKRFKSTKLGKTSLADYLWNLKREKSDLGGRRDKKQSFPISEIAKF